MIEGIILDYDGTAANTVPWFCKQLQHVLQARFRVKTSIEQIQVEMNEIFDQMPPNVHNARKHLLKAWYHVGRKRGLSPLRSLWLVYNTGKLVQSTDDVPPATEGLRKLLEWCHARSIKCALVSLSSRKRVMKFLTYHRIQPFFNLIFTKEQLGKHKNAAFSKIVESWKSNPKNILAVGDLPGDAIAARKAGLKPYLISTGFASRDFLSRTNLAPVIQDFHELLAVIETSDP